MTAKEKPQWEISAFDAFQAARDPSRKQIESRLLQDTFKGCGGSAVVAQALSWAFANDIRFIVDFQARGTNGSYTNGNGVVSLSSQLLAQRQYVEIAGTLTHEIRHAWQDAKGLLCSVAEDFSSFYIKQSLVEADAYAWGELARVQTYVGLCQSNGQVVADDIMDAFNNERAFLWRAFTHWYSERQEIYGHAFVGYLGYHLGMAGFGSPQLTSEFKPIDFISNGMDLLHIEDILPLGQMFKPGNYMRDADCRDFLLKKALSPTSALCMFNDTAHKPDRVNMRVEVEMKKRRKADPAFIII